MAYLYKSPSSDGKLIATKIECKPIITKSKTPNTKVPKFGAELHYDYCSFNTKVPKFGAELYCDYCNLLIISLSLLSNLRSNPNAKQQVEPQISLLIQKFYLQVFYHWGFDRLKGLDCFIAFIILEFGRLKGLNS